MRWRMVEGGVETTGSGMRWSVVDTTVGGRRFRVVEATGVGRRAYTIFSLHQ